MRYLVAVILCLMMVSCTERKPNHSVIKKNDTNIIFINMQTANEIITRQETYETKLLNKFFAKKKYPNYKCNLSNDISNYHEIDYHPNEKGYNELFECVKKILQDNLTKS